MSKTPDSGLENAPEHIQLAVDLIHLLESNKIDNKVAIAALEIVLTDFKNKVESRKYILVPCT